MLLLAGSNPCQPDISNEYYILIKNLERLKAVFIEVLMPLSHAQHLSGDRVHLAYS